MRWCEITDRRRRKAWQLSMGDAGGSIPPDGTNSVPIFTGWPHAVQANVRQL
jgi:hypothetical protein